MDHLPEDASSLRAFFDRHPVFTTRELDAFLVRRSDSSRVASERTRKSLLQYHQQRGRIAPIRRGLWAAAPAGRHVSSYPVDTFLIAANMAEDAVLAYHTALAAHGTAQSLRQERVILSEQQRVRPFTFQGVGYRGIRPPGALPDGIWMTLGVEEQDRQGLKIRVTSLERTLVDVLDRPALAGGWEEAWRSLEGLDVYLDLDFVARYALLLQNATTAAKVGYFLELHRERLFVEERHLDALRQRLPRTPHDAAPRAGRAAPTTFIRAWNLRVPDLTGELGGTEVPE